MNMASLTPDDNSHDGPVDWSLPKQCDRLGKELHSTKRENVQLKSLYEQSHRELKLCRDDQVLAQQQVSQLRKEMYDLKIHSKNLDDQNKTYKILMDSQHDEEVPHDSNQMLKNMYDTAVERYHDIRNELDQLKRLYNEVTAQNSSISEDKQRIKKLYEAKCEELAKDRSEMQSLRAQCTGAIHNWRSIYNEKLVLENSNTVIKQKLDEIVKEMASREKDFSLMAREKDEQLAMLRREKDELQKNHNLMMSERENVLKENNSFHDRVSDLTQKLNQQDLEQKSLEEMLVTYRKETQFALHDRDKARKDLHELRDMLHVFTQNGDISTIDDYLRSKKPDTTKERNEVAEDILSRRLPPQPFDMKDTVSDGHSSKEVDLLRKEIATLKKEVADAREHAGENKNRRDWAFNERDKIVLERESIRRQCDELRRERDRAVSNHAEVLRELDELKKFKQHTSKELKEVKEKLEKEERTNQLTRQSNSRDSAIDNDFQDWDTAEYQYDIDVSGYDRDRDLGLVIESAGLDATDSVLYVSSISEGSPCEGKLRVNDVLLNVNDVIVTFASKETVLKAIQAAQHTVTLVVKRKKPVGRFNVNVRLDLAKKDPGLQLETGLYISKITCGSLSAKEGNIAVGDRVLSVNAKSVEHKSAKEVMRMIQSSNDYVIMSVGKYGGHLSDCESNHDNTSQSLFTKVKSAFKVGDSHSSVHKSPSMEDGTGTTRRSKRGTPRQFQQYLQKIFKKTNNNGEEDDPGTIKMNADSVMKMFDRVIDQEEPGTWIRGTEGVDISSQGTVTVRQHVPPRSTIPSQFAEPSEIYGSFLQSCEGNRHSMFVSARSPEVDRKNDYPAKVNMEGHRHIVPPSPRIGTRTPNRDTNGAKTSTLPGSGGRSHMPVEAQEKSKSLDTRARQIPEQAYSHGFSSTTTSSSFTQNSAQSLDEAIYQFAKSHIMKKAHSRPNSLQTGNRPVSPNDSNRYELRTPSSPLHKPKSSVGGPESPQPLPPYNLARPSSAAGQPYQPRHNSNGQLSFPSKPHLVMNPTHSQGPPPYTVDSRIYEEKSSSFYQQTAQMNVSSSSVPPYQSQTWDRKYHGYRDYNSRPMSTNGEYPTNRVKFPSNLSMSSSTKKSMNSSSLEVVSGRSSPMSPITSEFHRHSEEFIQKSQTLKEGVLREIELDTSSGSLGIRIEESDNGIFVSAVSQNSLAEEVGIHVGDQIVEFCGINMRTATYEVAKRFLSQWRSGDAKALMKVQYNPNKYKCFPDQDSDVDRNSVTGSIQTIHTYMSENGTLNKKSLCVVHSNGSSGDDSRLDPPRTVSIRKTTHNAGIRLCGGNATGVFVGEIYDHSPAAISGLRVGDHILEMNGKSVENATAEQAATELNRPIDTLNMVVQYDINRYSTIHAGGDHFYVRTHFNYDAENDGELSIKVGDLLLVEDSLLHGQIGKWYAWKIDEHDQKLHCGVVPSRIRLEETSSLKRSFSDVLHDDDGKSSKRNGSMNRRSFFKRRSSRHQHQRSSSRESRELTSFSDLSTSSDNVPIADDGMPLLYQRVRRVDCNIMRPVVILGPFSEALVQKLVSESPDKYAQYEEECMNTATSVIEKGIADGVFIDFKKVNDLFKVVRTQTLHEIAVSNRHSLLLVHPTAVERMIRCDLYPIVIYIKHKSLKQVRDVKDPRFLPERLSSRSAKELFEYFQKVEMDYKNVFTVEVQGSNMAAMSQNIKKSVDIEQSKKVWLPLL